MPILTRTLWLLLAGVLLTAAAPVVLAQTATVTIETIDAVASELGANTAAFRFTRTGSTVSPLRVKVTFDSTTTAVLGDYSDNSGGYLSGLSEVEIPATSLTFDLIITPLADNLVEGQELLDLSLAAGSYVIGNPSAAGITIADDAPVVTLSAFDGAAAEAGGNTGTFRFTRSGGKIGAELTVNVTFDPTTTASFADHDDNSGGFLEQLSQVRIPAASATFDLIITPLADNLVEGQELLDLSLATGSYVKGNPSAAGITIADDAPVVTLSAFDGAAAEGGNTGTFRFSRSGGKIGAALTVNVSFGPATTASFVDYASNSGGFLEQLSQVLIPAASATFDLIITPLTDNLVEGEELLDINLAAGSYVIGNPNSARITIADEWIFGDGFED